MSALYFHHYGRMFRIVATFPAAEHRVTLQVVKRRTPAMRRSAWGPR